MSNYEKEESEVKMTSKNSKIGGELRIFKVFFRGGCGFLGQK
jgi:hypothetical protein